MKKMNQQVQLIHLTYQIQKNKSCVEWCISFELIISIFSVENCLNSTENVYGKLVYLLLVIRLSSAYPIFVYRIDNIINIIAINDKNKFLSFIETPY